MTEPLSAGASSHPDGRPFTDEVTGPRLHEAPADSMAVAIDLQRTGRTREQRPAGGGGSGRERRAEDKAGGIPSPAMDGRQPDRGGIAGADPVGAGAVDPPRGA